MRRVMVAVWAVAVFVGLGFGPLYAQDADEPEPAPEVGRYVPPPAWKSVEVGDFYLKRKSYRAALSRYKEAAKIDPYYAQSYLGMGKVYDRLGLRQKALENYRKFLDLLPSSKEAEEAHDVHQAIARLERQLRPSRRPPPAHSPSESSGSSD